MGRPESRVLATLDVLAGPDTAHHRDRRRHRHPVRRILPGHRNVHCIAWDSGKRMYATERDQKTTVLATTDPRRSEP